MRIVFRAKALRELETIERSIAKDSPAAAAKPIANIERKIARLSEHPLSAPAGPHPGTRCLAVLGSPYLVIYTVRRDDILVLAVLHGGQNRRI